MGRTVLIDRGWLRIQRDMVALSGRGLKVGLRAGGPADGPGKARKRRGRRTRSVNTTPIVQYGAWNEFGTEHIPARPWMRRAADEAPTPLQNFTARRLRDLVAGRMGADDVLDAVGLWYQRLLRASVRSAGTWAAPNAPSTIAAKGSSQPLIDNASLMGAIDYEKTGR